MAVPLPGVGIVDFAVFGKAAGAQRFHFVAIAPLPDGLLLVGVDFNIYVVGHRARLVGKFQAVGQKVKAVGGRVGGVVTKPDIFSGGQFALGESFLGNQRRADIFAGGGGIAAGNQAGYLGVDSVGVVPLDIDDVIGVQVVVNPFVGIVGNFDEILVAIYHGAVPQPLAGNVVVISGYPGADSKMLHILRRAAVPNLVLAASK